MMVSTSAGVLLKILEVRKKVHTTQLIKFANHLKLNDVELYTFRIDYMGKLNSGQMWDDITFLIMSSMITLSSENVLEITKKGLEMIKEFDLILTTEIEDPIKTFNW